MSEKMRPVIERFPEYEARIHQTFETNANFNALCRQYSEVTEAIRRLEGSPDASAGPEVKKLHKRRAALDDELLAMMQQTARV